MKAPLTGLCSASLFAVLWATPALAGAIPYPNIGTINPDTYSFTAENTGTLTAYFYASTAGDLENLNIYDTTASTSVMGVFPSYTTATGTTATLAVTAGDTIVFTIFDLTTSVTISSVPANNSDGQQHIYSTAFAGGNVNVTTASGQGSAFIPAGTYIGFEDTIKGDFNYADEQFVFQDTALSTNGGPAQITDAPEPASMLIMGTAAAGIGAARRRRRAR